jgi:uncharacterized protein YggE
MAGEESRGVTVVGVGRVDVVPDRLSLFLAVETRAATPADALRTVAASEQSLSAVLDEAGIGATVAAYGVEVTVDDLDAASRIVIDAASAVGDDFRIHGAYWRFADPQDAVTTARAEAVAAGIRQAKELAAAAGVTLGRLVAMEEVDGSRSHAFAAAAMEVAHGGPRFEPGQSRVAVAVRLEFELA